MPRIGRLHIPGGYYHVMGRGLERRFIFNANADKNDFLIRFGENLTRVNAHCLAWALMSNHYHFLIQMSEEPLAKLMAPVLGGFAGSYNRRHDRCGYVFQNRYKSILIDADAYLLELVRYIHLNPVRAGMVTNVKELGTYPWTGHAGILGKHKQGWHSVNSMLAYFGENARHSRTSYLNFLEDADNNLMNTRLTGGGLIRSHGGWQNLEQLRREHISCIGDERILGSSDFVECALRHDELSIEHNARLVREGWDLNKLAKWVCEKTGVSREQLFSKTRGGRPSEAKSMLCYLGSKELRLTMREIAGYLSIAQPSVTERVKKGRPLCKANGLSLDKMDR